MTGDPTPDDTPTVIQDLTYSKVTVVDVLHLTGGLRARGGKDARWIGPLTTGGKLKASAPFKDAELGPLIAACGLQLFGAEEKTIGVDDLVGRAWTPLVGLPMAPADTWGMIAAHARSKDDLAYASLARNVTIALRAADLQARNLSDEYHRQLVAALQRNQALNQRFANTALIDLHLAGHSLLAEMGSARDYIAQVAARRVNAPDSVDALNRLVAWLGKPANAAAKSDPLVVQLLDAIDQSDPWLEDIGSYRNLFLHRQPLGADEHARFLRLIGRQTPIGEVRAISLTMTLHVGSAETCEAQERFVELYRRLSRLAHQAATLAKYTPKAPSFVAS